MERRQGDGAEFLEAEMGNLLTAPWVSGEAEAMAGSCL